MAVQTILDLCQELNFDVDCDTFIDLFAGIGGFRFALEKKGLQCVFSSEKHNRTAELYKQIWGEQPHGDITNIPASNRTFG